MSIKEEFLNDFCEKHNIKNDGLLLCWKGNKFDVINPAGKYSRYLPDFSLDGISTEGRLNMERCDTYFDKVSLAILAPKEFYSVLGRKTMKRFINHRGGYINTKERTVNPAFDACHAMRPHVKDLGSFSVTDYFFVIDCVDESDLEPALATLMKAKEDFPNVLKEIEKDFDKKLEIL